MQVDVSGIAASRAWGIGSRQLVESVSGPGACRSQWGAVATDRSLIPRVDSGVELRSITPGEYRGDWIDRNSLGIWVPTRFNVTFSSHGGGVSGVEGRFSGNTAGGRIMLDNVSGCADHGRW